MIHRRNADDSGVERSAYNPLAPDEQPYYAELAHFLSCFERGVEPQVTACDADGREDFVGCHGVDAQQPPHHHLEFQEDQP